MRREAMRWIAVVFTVVWLLLRGHEVTIVHEPEVRLEWDAVTTLSGGGPIPAEDAITYEVSLNGELQGSTAETFFDLTLAAEGQYTLEVRTVRTTSTGLVERSEDAALQATLLFTPAAPINLILSRRP